MSSLSDAVVFWCMLNNIHMPNVLYVRLLNFATLFFF